MNYSTNLKIRQSSAQGTVIIFAVLILAVVLAVSLSLVSAFLPQLQAVREAGNSAAAIAAADSVTELCLYEARKQIAINRIPPLLTNGATFTIASLSSPEVDVTNDCTLLGNESFRFRARATYLNTSRAFEVSQ